MKTISYVEFDVKSRMAAELGREDYEAGRPMRSEAELYQELNKRYREWLARVD